MDRENFWEIVRAAADFMIDVHARLIAEHGQAFADDQLANGIAMSNYMMSFSEAFPREDKLGVAIQHCAFGVATLYIDLDAHGVNTIAAKPLESMGEKAFHLL